jgi:mono/diheme cytochrome c family protein
MLALLATLGLPAAAGDPVLAVFAAKCARCHGPDAQPPKGQLGYITDLQRLAAEPELVVTGKPDASRLWQLVAAGTMPPAGAPDGPLDAAQRATVRSWIESLAPVALPAPAPLSAWERSLAWLGKLHLLALHFPIALSVLATLAEAWAWCRGRLPPRFVLLCLRWAACSALPVAALGWLLARTGLGAGNPEVLLAHRWLGTLAALWLLAAAWSAEVDAQGGHRTIRTRVLIFGGALLVAAAAHLGGSLVHGVDFLSW